MAAERDPVEVVEEEQADGSAGDDGLGLPVREGLEDMNTLLDAVHAEPARTTSADAWSSSWDREEQQGAVDRLLRRGGLAATASGVRSEGGNEWAWSDSAEEGAHFPPPPGAVRQTAWAGAWRNAIDGGDATFQASAAELRIQRQSGLHAIDVRQRWAREPRSLHPIAALPAGAPDRSFQDLELPAEEMEGPMAPSTDWLDEEFHRSVTELSEMEVPQRGQGDAVPGGSQRGYAGAAGLANNNTRRQQVISRLKHKRSRVLAISDHRSRQAEHVGVPSSSRKGGGGGPFRAGEIRAAASDLVASTRRTPNARSAATVGNCTIEQGGDAAGGPEWMEDVGGVLPARDEAPHFDLTSDLLHKVFSFLIDTDLCRAATVCRQWRAVSAHEEFWHTLNFEDRQVSHQQVAHLCRTYPKAVNLNLKGAPCVDEDLVCGALHSLRGLRTLVLGRGFLSEGFFQGLSKNCPLLEKLSITYATLGNNGAQEIRLQHSKLQELEAVKCRALRLAVHCPALETLSLRRTGMASAHLVCPELQSLDINGCHKLSDTSARSAVAYCTKLTSLDISSCAYMTDESLREIAQACPMLAVLDASHCPNLTLEGLRLPSLVELRLLGCEGINSSSMVALGYCMLLETLLLDYCWLLALVNLELPSLRTISLLNCRKLVEVVLQAPSLVELDVTSCTALTKLEVISQSVQSLALARQAGLSTVSLRCPWLRTLDLTDCDSLPNNVCEVLSDGGGCPQLNTLTLDSCEGLTEVRLTTSSLNSLSLIGCRNMWLLQLACPDLTCLLLDGCDALTHATLAPVSLASLNLGICPHLTELTVVAPSLHSVDLRGCGAVKEASLDCPRLTALDASYCSQLSDTCLSSAARDCRALQSLVLAACPAVGPAGLEALAQLHTLTTLDLSYTEITDLGPLFNVCPSLKVLHLSACKWLADDALVALHHRAALPSLRELDISYCNLPDQAIGDLLANCLHLTHISLNGCSKLTDAVWSRLSSAPTLGGEPVDDMAVDSSADAEAPRTRRPGKEVVMEDEWMLLPEEARYRAGPSLPQDEPMHEANYRQLSSLSCVGCTGLQKVVMLSPSSVPELSVLNLSLSSNIQEVQLACPALTLLNMTNCLVLASLELACPRLSVLSLQADNRFSAEALDRALATCPVLETLDLRSCTWLSSTEPRRLRSAFPGLKRLYTSLTG